MTDDQSVEKDRTLLYVVGELPGTILEVLSERFQIEAYNGENDAYLLIVSVMVEAPTKATREAVREAWEKGGKIALLYPTISAVRRIREILNITRSLTSNAATMEYYGIQRYGENVIDIEIHGGRAEPSDVATGSELSGLGGNDAGLEEQTPEQRRVIALANWLISPAPSSQGTVTPTSGPESLDFTSHYLTRFYTSGIQSDWQETWFAIRVYSEEQKLYWISYWVEVIFNSRAGNSVDYFTLAGNYLATRCVGSVCDRARDGKWIDRDPTMIGNEMMTPSPVATQRPVETLSVSTSTTIGGGVSVGTSGIDLTFSYGVSMGNERSIQVPPLTTTPSHDLRTGMPFWKWSYREPVRSGSQQLYCAWVHRFPPDQITVVEGRREIQLQTYSEMGAEVPYWYKREWRWLTVPLPCPLAGC